MKSVAVLLLLIFLSGCSSDFFRDTPVPSFEDNNFTDGTYTEITTSTRQDLLKIDGEFTLPILVFHHIDLPDQSITLADRTWYVTENKFERILDFIEKNGFVTYTITEIMGFLEKGFLPHNVVVITFDDGAADFYYNAWPILQKYNMKSTVNIMTGVNSRNYLSKENIKELYATGLVDFQSHGVYHSYLTRSSESEMRFELSNSKKMLENLLDKEVVVVAYPFGLYNDIVESVAKEIGYKAGLTIKGRSKQKNSDFFELHRTIVTENTDIKQLLLDINN